MLLSGSRDKVPRTRLSMCDKVYLISELNHISFKIIRSWDPRVAYQPQCSFIGHSDMVRSLLVSQQNDLVFCSIVFLAYQVDCFRVV
jgi:hypothetical protein